MQKLFDPEKKIFETCVRNYIDATKLESLETIECSICAEALRKTEFAEIAKPVRDIPNIELLSAENSIQRNLDDEYVYEDYLEDNAIK